MKYINFRKERVMKKIVGIIVSTVICVPFLMANVVTATSTNSKAGITFSNSYTPNTSTDPTKINTKKRHLIKIKMEINIYRKQEARHGTSNNI